MSFRVHTFVGVALIGFALGGETSNARADDFLDRIMQVLGISATPSQMKGESDVSAGQVWIADVEHGIQTALTTDAGYRWPVYESGGEAIVALESDRLVRIAAANGKVTLLHGVPSVEKLVGFDRKDPDKLLVLLGEGTAPLALLSLKSGNLTPLPYDPKSKEHRRMLSHAKGEERVYGDARVYVKTESKQTLGGELEWGEVYLQEGGAPPRDISHGAGVNCNQPSLSPDGKAVVYIRASGAS